MVMSRHRRKGRNHRRGNWRHPVELLEYRRLTNRDAPRRLVLRDWVNWKLEPTLEELGLLLP